MLRVPLLSRTRSRKTASKCLEYFYSARLGLCALSLEPFGICLEFRLGIKSLEPAREVLRVPLLSTRASERN